MKNIIYAMIDLFITEKGIEPIEGKFRVLYNDGRKSIRMYYRNAKKYAKMFGGKVFYEK